MQEPITSYEPVAIRQRMVRANAGATLFEAVLLLLIGFVFIRGLSGISDWELFNVVVAVTVWTFKVGGLLMLGVAVLGWLSCAIALLFDIVVNALIGSVLILSSAVWLLAGEVYGLLFMLVGGMLLHSMHRSWRNYRSAGLALQALMNVVSGDGPVREPAARSCEDVFYQLDLREDEACPTCRKALDNPDANRIEAATTPDARPAICEPEPLPPEGFLAELGRQGKED